MVSEYRDAYLRKAQSALEEWKGSNAKIWEYQVSHRQIVLRLEHEGKKGNLHVICLDPTWFSGPFRWAHSDVNLSHDESGQTVKVSDAEHQFELVCDRVEVEADCDPIF